MMQEILLKMAHGPANLHAWSPQLHFKYLLSATKTKQGNRAGLQGPQVVGL